MPAVLGIPPYGGWCQESFPPGKGGTTSSSELPMMLMTCWRHDSWTNGLTWRMIPSWRVSQVCPEVHGMGSALWTCGTGETRDGTRLQGSAHWNDLANSSLYTNRMWSTIPLDTSRMNPCDPWKHLKFADVQADLRSRRSTFGSRHQAWHP